MGIKQKNFQNGRLKKKLRFSKQPILEIFWRKFHRMILGLVVLIDGMNIDAAQPIWQGCSNVPKRCGDTPKWGA